VQRAAQQVSDSDDLPPGLGSDVEAKAVQNGAANLIAADPDPEPDLPPGLDPPPGFVDHVAAARRTKKRRRTTAHTEDGAANTTGTSDQGNSSGGSKKDHPDEDAVLKLSLKKHPFEVMFAPDARGDLKLTEFREVGLWIEQRLYEKPEVSKEEKAAKRAARKAAKEARSETSASPGAGASSSASSSDAKSIPSAAASAAGAGSAAGKASSSSSSAVVDPSPSQSGVDQFQGRPRRAYKYVEFVNGRSPATCPRFVREYKGFTVEWNIDKEWFCQDGTRVHVLKRNEKTYCLHLGDRLIEKSNCEAFEEKAAANAASAMRAKGSSSPS
tara:strand:+ start:371 stop:1354 length:984 start_codon:yes stop_codon:yes gene_type:complete